MAILLFKVRQIFKRKHNGLTVQKKPSEAISKKETLLENPKVGDGNGYNTDITNQSTVTKTATPYIIEAMLKIGEICLEQYLL